MVTGKEKALRAAASVALTIGTIAGTLAPAAALAQAPATPPKNVILMISDGWGYNEVTATDYYLTGAAGTALYEAFPMVTGMANYSVGKGYDTAKAWSDFGYRMVPGSFTDSASAATAMSTGVKTYDAAIGVDSSGGPLTHVFQRAEEVGKSTGVVTSVEWSHATPAGFVAHNVSRNSYAEIAREMLSDSATDVIMGAGNPMYTDDGVAGFNSDSNEDGVADAHQYKYVGGQSTWDSLLAGTLRVSDANGDGKADPWTVIQTRAQFQALAGGSAPDRVVGIAQAATTLQQARSGDGQAAAFAVPLDQNVPTLTEMSLAAINVLDNDPDGFYLMIEGGAADWANHANQAGRSIEEQADFNAAVEAVVAWVNANSNWNDTLLIVTGDHETGYLTGPKSGAPATWTEIVNNGKGVMPGMEYHSTDHSNQIIPLYAQGAYAPAFAAYADQTDKVRGRYIDNTEIAKLLFAALADSAAVTPSPLLTTTDRARVGITAPANGQALSGQVTVAGTATTTAPLAYYKLEYSADGGKTWVVALTDDPATKSVNESLPTKAVTDGTLGVWNTTAVPDGAYRLHAVAVDNTGNYVASFALSVAVDNAG